MRQRLSLSMERYVAKQELKVTVVPTQQTLCSIAGGYIAGGLAGVRGPSTGRTVQLLPL